MKKALVSAALMLALNALPMLEATAKPAYCNTALRFCYADCWEFFSSDVLRAFCNGGCLIGYYYCG